MSRKAGDRLDKCTYGSGYLRQAIWACKTCQDKGADVNHGVCLGCSMNCHADHELYELNTKRGFRCDCGNTTARGLLHSPDSRAHTDRVLVRSCLPAGTGRCCLTSSKDLTNEKNKYSHNFSGLYCRCNQARSCRGAFTCKFLAVAYFVCDSTLSQTFDGQKAMVQCPGCDDWFHFDCIDSVSRTWLDHVRSLCLFSRVLCCVMHSSVRLCRRRRLPIRACSCAAAAVSGSSCKDTPNKWALCHC